MHGCDVAAGLLGASCDAATASLGPGLMGDAPFRPGMNLLGMCPTSSILQTPAQTVADCEGSRRALRCFTLTAQTVHCAGGCATHLGTVGTTAYSATNVRPCAEGNDLERFCPIRHRSNKQLWRSGFFCRPSENNRRGS